MQGPNWSLPFHISTNTSTETIGLHSRKRKNNDPTLSILSLTTLLLVNKIILYNKNLIVVHVINKFLHYIIGYLMFIHINHSTIHYLMNIYIFNGTETSWLHLLQEFDITILNKPGNENGVVDSLFKPHNEAKATPIEDIFLNEHFFYLSINTSLFVDIFNYLTAGKLTQNLYSRERQKVIKQSVMYSCLLRYLFCT